MYQKYLGTVQEAKLGVIIGKQKIDPFHFSCSFVLSKFPNSQEVES